jgi:hypothetical protein
LDDPTLCLLGASVHPVLLVIAFHVAWPFKLC